MFPLYRELTARDLLQRRVTDTAGSTAWADSPLIRAAREGEETQRKEEREERRRVMRGYIVLCSAVPCYAVREERREVVCW